MLPQYVTKANSVLNFLSEQPDKIWAKTQRELSEELNISQPELSLLVKFLVDSERVRKGAPLPGVRGRNRRLEVIDTTPVTIGKSRVRHTSARAQESAALLPEEEVHGSIDLRQLSPEQVGAAILRTLQATWIKDERHNELQAQQLTKIRELRELLTVERQTRQQLVSEKERLVDECETLRHRLEEGQHEINRIRGDLNKMLVSSRQARSGGTFTIRESLNENELRLLDSLMRTKPGFYRESDAELGLPSAS